MVATRITQITLNKPTFLFPLTTASSALCFSGKFSFHPMKTLSASTTIFRIVVDRTRDARFFPSFHTNDRLSRTGACFLRFQKSPNFGFFHSLSVRNGGIVPISAISSNLQATEIQTAESHNQETYHSKTVRVKFQLQRECMFGEQFLMVGDDPVFGLWDPSNAVPLHWSDGHLWMTELDIPVAKSIQFKFILRRQKGDILWQPGPDRIFQAWETRNAIVVCEDWDDAESQKIIEEQIPNQIAFPALWSETSKDSKVLVPNMDQDGTSSLAGESGTHADTVSYSNKSSTATATNTILDSEEGTDPYQESKTESNKKSLKHNYEAARTTRNLSMNEGAPVLVPGLTQPKTTKNEEAVDEGGSEAQDHYIPELDSNQDPASLTSERNTGMYNVEDNLVSRKFKEKFAMVKIEEAILKNDREWGRKMLQAFFNTLRILWHQT